ncbi:hypothetical protein BESB_060740 [Besnoitia besnoiti]|uniref:Uncharacterized protein n=1 Tax=Besnoitia besnoiti TaxID=94643 RepID=A0A2A9MHW7_BESBE|nr:hypothetical protein BESB_060740 [Besnoitia besnoiti]PFH35187.1 hypothetical protein BESB_060740 [Besnoitia besnoiti]
MPHSVAVFAALSGLGASATHASSAGDVADLFQGGWSTTTLPSLPTFVVAVGKTASGAFHHGLTFLSQTTGGMRSAAAAAPSSFSSLFCTGAVPIYSGGSSVTSAGAGGTGVGSHAIASKFLGLSSNHAEDGAGAAVSAMGSPDPFGLFCTVKTASSTGVGGASTKAVFAKTAGGKVTHFFASNGQRASTHSQAAHSSTSTVGDLSTGAAAGAAGLLPGPGSGAAATQQLPVASGGVSTDAPAANFLQLFQADHTGPAAGGAAVAASKTTLFTHSSAHTKQTILTKAAAHGGKKAFGKHTSLFGKKKKGGFGKSSASEKRVAKAAAKRQRQEEAAARKEQKHIQAQQRKAEKQQRKEQEAARKRERQIEKENEKSREREQRRLEKQEKARYREDKERLREEQRRYRKLRKEEETLEKEREKYGEREGRARVETGYRSGVYRRPSYEHPSSSYGQRGYGAPYHRSYSPVDYRGTYDRGYNSGRYTSPYQRGYGASGYGAAYDRPSGYSVPSYGSGYAPGGGARSYAAGPSYGAPPHGVTSIAPGTPAVTAHGGYGMTGTAPPGVVAHAPAGAEPGGTVQYVYSKPGEVASGTKSVRVIQDIAETKNGITTHHVTETVSTSKANVPSHLVPPVAVGGPVEGPDYIGGDDYNDGGDVSPIEEAEEFSNIREIQLQVTTLLFGLWRQRGDTNEDDVRGRRKKQGKDPTSWSSKKLQRRRERRARFKCLRELRVCPSEIVIKEERWSVPILETFNGGNSDRRGAKVSFHRQTEPLRTTPGINSDESQVWETSEEGSCVVDDGNLMLLMGRSDADTQKAFSIEYGWEVLSTAWREDNAELSGYDGEEDSSGAEGMEIEKRNGPLSSGEGDGRERQPKWGSNRAYQEDCQSSVERQDQHAGRNEGGETNHNRKSWPPRTMKHFRDDRASLSFCCRRVQLSLLPLRQLMYHDFLA